MQNVKLRDLAKSRDWMKGCIEIYCLRVEGRRVGKPIELSLPEAIGIVLVTYCVSSAVNKTGSIANSHYPFDLSIRN